MAFGDVVQSNAGTGTTATVAPTLGSAVTSGNLVVLTFAADDYNGTPTAGWTQSAEMEQQTFHGGYLWWLKSTGGAIPGYTIGSAARSTWTLVEYEGPFDASPYDISEGQFQQSSVMTNYTTASMTPTAGDRLMVAGLQAQNSSTEQASWGTFTNSFTQAATSLYNGGNPRLSIVQLKHVVAANGSTAYSTGGQYAVTSESRSATIIAFKKGAAGGGSGKPAKVWSGSAWVTKPVKVWSGSAWVTKPTKVWNGSAWV